MMEPAIHDVAEALSVLLVEDAQGDESLAREALTAPPGRSLVTTVGTLDQALAALAEHEFDCVLADLGLPDAEGLEVLGRISEQASGAAIVVLTGRRDPGLGRDAIRAGADDYLVKGAHTDQQLVRAVEYAVERTRLDNLMTRLAARSAVVMNALGDGLLVLDTAGRVESANPVARTMLGVDDPVGETLGSGGWSLSLPGPSKGGEEHQLLSPDRRLHVLSMLQDTRGGVRRVEVSTHPLFDRQEHFDGVVLLLRDVEERLAAEAAVRFQARLLDAVGQAVIATDPIGTVLYWNLAAERLYGWSSAEAVGRLIVELTPTEASAEQAAAIMDSLSHGNSWTGDFSARARDDSRLWVLVTNMPVLDDDGELVAIIGVSIDITARKHAEETAQAAAAVIASTVDAVSTETLDGIIRSWNRGAEMLYGYSAEDVIGEHISLIDTTGGQEIAGILATVAEGGAVRGIETMRRHRDGSLIDVSLTVSPIFDGAGNVVAASKIARDISESRRLERELARQALRDALTDLPNRALLGDRLTQTLANAERAGAPVAVLFVDLDHFKRINDTRGHLVGDQLLVEVARRLVATVRPNDTVARFGGDEFVIVCEALDDEEAHEIARRVLEALAAPVELSGQQCFVTASVGIAVAPPIDRDPTTLLRCADLAMYDAKSRGRASASLFDPRLEEQSQDRMELTSDLRDALQQGGLAVYYQPQVDLETGRLIGLEALSRWRHPTRGFVPPSLFVPLAEESGLIRALDQQALRRACHDINLLRRRGVVAGDVRVAVNISARNTDAATLHSVVVDTAADALTPLDALELEVTETALMHDLGGASDGLQALRELGVNVALDDFGTGYSSLTYLRRLPVTTIKIDREFIEHITDRHDDLAITASIADLGRAIGLRTVAEGVETPEQLATLIKLGCTAGQGYLWSPALPLDDLVALLGEHPHGFGPPPPPGITSAATSGTRPQQRPVTEEHGLSRLLALHRAGASLTTIAAALNAEGYRRPTGVRWHPSTVARAVAAQALVAFAGPGTRPAPSARRP